MQEILATALLALAGVIALAVPAWAAHARGRSYAIFGLVILLFSLPGALVTHALLAGRLEGGARLALTALFLWGTAAAGLHLFHLVRARLRGRVFRLLVSLPGHAFLAAGFLAGLWQLALLPVRGGLAAFDLALPTGIAIALDAFPLLVAAVSMRTSGRRALEWVRLQLDGSHGPDEVTRVPVARRRGTPPAPDPEALRIVQITDPHLGPWQPVARLRRTLEWLLAHEPDLVLLTGDFLTMEGQGTPGALAEALTPLRAVPERCFAIFGNHDHEAPEEVRSALAANGVRLLLDEEEVVETHLGPVQIVGADWVRRGTREHLEALLDRHPRRPGHLRLLLLHDPLGFRHVPVGSVDLVLSGHTHGGQLGLVSLGLDWTVLSRSAWPDHGLFAKGSNRLYVHRGTGFYGFPLRIGVPPEHSVLELVPEGRAGG